MMCTNVCRFRPKAEAQSSEDQGREKAMERRRSAASLPSGEWGGMDCGEREKNGADLGYFSSMWALAICTGGKRVH